jgi:hypothetical protein
MMIKTDPTGNESLGYVPFCSRLKQDPDFAEWFSRLRSDLDSLVTADRAKQLRLIILQRALIDLIEYLDPDQLRLPAKYRDRLALPAEQATTT